MTKFISETSKIVSAVRRYSRSVKTVIGSDEISDYVEIKPVFQKPYSVRSLDQWEQSVKDGWCAVPDSETAFG
jgi:hypothetical protein